MGTHGTLCSRHPVITTPFAQSSFYRYDDYVKVMVSTGAFPEFVPTVLRDFVKFTPKILLPIAVGINEGGFYVVVKVALRWF